MTGEHRRFLSSIRVGDGCWEWQLGKGRHGYGKMKLFGRSAPAHRAAWFFRHGSWPAPGLHVCHTCDNPACVRWDHLFVGSNSDNMWDASRKGRLNVAHRQRPPAYVNEIRASRERTGVLAARYGLAPVSVQQIRNGRKWKHVPPPPAEDK